MDEDDQKQDDKPHFDGGQGRDKSPEHCSRLEHERDAAIEESATPSKGTGVHLL